MTKCKSITRILFLFLILSSFFACKDRQESLGFEHYFDMRIKDTSFRTQVAISSTEQAMGLMYRDSLGKMDSMIFVYPSARRVSFWMKNTYLNMVIFYLDKDFNILEIFYPTPLSEKSMTSKSDKVQYILELNPKLEKTVRDSWSEFSELLKSNLKNKESEIAKYQSM